MSEWRNEQVRLKCTAPVQGGYECGVVHSLVTMQEHVLTSHMTKLEAEHLAEWKCSCGAFFLSRCFMVKHRTDNPGPLHMHIVTKVALEWDANSPVPAAYHMATQKMFHLMRACVGVCEPEKLGGLQVNHNADEQHMSPTTSSSRPGQHLNHAAVDQPPPHQVAETFRRLPNPHLAAYQQHHALHPGQQQHHVAIPQIPGRQQQQVFPELPSPHRQVQQQVLAQQQAPARNQPLATLADPQPMFFGTGNTAAIPIMTPIRPAYRAPAGVHNRIDSLLQPVSSSTHERLANLRRRRNESLTVLLSRVDPVEAPQAGRTYSYSPQTPRFSPTPPPDLAQNPDSDDDCQIVDVEEKPVIQQKRKCEVRPIVIQRESSGYRESLLATTVQRPVTVEAFIPLHDDTPQQGGEFVLRLRSPGGRTAIPVPPIPPLRRQEAQIGEGGRQERQVDQQNGANNEHNRPITLQGQPADLARATDSPDLLSLRARQRNHSRECANNTGRDMGNHYPVYGGRYCGEQPGPMAEMDPLYSHAEIGDNMHEEKERGRPTTRMDSEARRRKRIAATERALEMVRERKQSMVAEAVPSSSRNSSRGPQGDQPGDNSPWRKRSRSSGPQEDQPGDVPPWRQDNPNRGQQGGHREDAPIWRLRSVSRGPQGSQNDDIPRWRQRSRRRDSQKDQLSDATPWRQGNRSNGPQGGQPEDVPPWRHRSKSRGPQEEQSGDVPPWRQRSRSRGPRGGHNGDVPPWRQRSRSRGPQGDQQANQPLWGRGRNVTNELEPWNSAGQGQRLRRASTPYRRNNTGNGWQGNAQWRQQKRNEPDETQGSSGTRDSTPPWRKKRRRGTPIPEARSRSATRESTPPWRKKPRRESPHREDHGREIQSCSAARESTPPWRKFRRDTPPREDNGPEVQNNSNEIEATTSTTATSMDNNDRTGTAPQVELIPQAPQANEETLSENKSSESMERDPSPEIKVVLEMPSPISQNLDAGGKDKNAPKDNERRPQSFDGGSWELPSPAEFAKLAAALTKSPASLPSSSKTTTKQDGILGLPKGHKWTVKPAFNRKDSPFATATKGAATTTSFVSRPDDTSLPATPAHEGVIFGLPKKRRTALWAVHADTAEASTTGTSGTEAATPGPTTTGSSTTGSSNTETTSSTTETATTSRISPIEEKPLAKTPKIRESLWRQRNRSEAILERANPADDPPQDYAPPVVKKKKKAPRKPRPPLPEEGVPTHTMRTRSRTKPNVSTNAEKEE